MDKNIISSDKESLGYKDPSILNTMKIKCVSKIFLYILFILYLEACTEDKPTINIAVASNFEATLKKIITIYSSTHKEHEINLISASSGILTNQIINNAPFDLFLSADIEKPQFIYEKLKLKVEPKVYAIGKLALWIPNSSSGNCLDQLANLKTLAIANPKTAPYGKIANKILIENNIIIQKTIQTSNVLQAYIYTNDGLTDAGFVPYSLVNNKSNSCLQVFDNSELSQSIILLNKKALDLYNFINSSEIQQLILDSGYQ